ncbi:MAG TPA: hypothetical protein GXX36_14030 [Clostridiaceae bacterium]|nr:hypothetical protein [Clostridiaceae bacterium]
MKKVISMILTISMILILTATISYAADPITVSVSLDYNTNTVTIFGTISSGQGKQVTVIIIHPSGGIDYIEQTTSGENGYYEFKHVLNENKTGEYIVKVGGTGIDSPVSTTFTFDPPAPADQSPGGIVIIPEEPKTELDITMAELTEALAGTATALFKIPEVEGATSYMAKLPSSAFASGNVDKKITIETKFGTITVPMNMLSAAEVANAQKVSISIASVDKTTLSAALQDEIGNRPVIDINLLVDDNVKAWSNPDAPITISIPYIPTAEELGDPEHIAVWYIDGAGNVVSIPSGRYDAKTGMVTFTTTHLSKYAVAFVKKTFDDIANYAWAKKEIEVMASKGIINGTSATTYSPAQDITRADFIVLLVRALGLDGDVNDNFSDVNPDAYYAKQVGIAKKLGITKGVGNNEFKPGEKIVRQDMMTLIDRAMKVVGKGLAQGTETDLAGFADKDMIASFAKDSVATLVKSGIIKGDGININPLGNTIRAEAAVVVYRIYNEIYSK